MAVFTTRNNIKGCFRTRVLKVKIAFPFVQSCFVLSTPLTIELKEDTSYHTWFLRVFYRLKFSFRMNDCRHKTWEGDKFLMSGKAENFKYHKDSFSICQQQKTTKMRPQVSVRQIFLVMQSFLQVLQRVPGMHLSCPLTCLGIGFAVMQPH